MKTTTTHTGIFIILLFLTSIFGVKAQAQIIFDGVNCNSSPSSSGTGTEWGTPQATDFDGVNPTSSNLEEFWARIQGPYLYVAFSREGKGNAGFAMHIDTDCDSTNNNTTYNGADYAFFFSIQSGQVQDSSLWVWDTLTSAYITSSDYFSPLIGGTDCIDTANEEFFEIRIPITTLMDACGGSCENLRITQANIHSGGSFSSTIKDELELSLSLSINEVAIATITADAIVCANELVNISGLASDANPGLSGNYDYISLYEWDMSYDGVTFNVEATGSSIDTIYTTATSHTVALRVYDAFGCLSEIDTFTISTYVRPTLVYDILGGNTCSTMHAYSALSIDNAGADNLIHFWDLGDGNTSASDSFTHYYDTCVFHTLLIKVTDPDNPAACASDSVIISSVLPVEMLDLNAKRVNDGVQVKWITASEENTDYFEVQYSKDGINYQIADVVEAKGGDEITEYIYHHYEFVGLTYYRIKAVDYSGESQFYGPVAVRLENNLVLEVYPNPSSECIKLKEVKEEIVDIEIYTSNGYLIERISGHAVGESIDICMLEKGSYFIKTYYSNQETAEAMFLKL